MPRLQQTLILRCAVMGNDFNYLANAVSDNYCNYYNY